MTEEQIENKVEQLFNRLDAQLISGKISQKEYDGNAELISEWAKQKYKTMPIFVRG